MSLIQISMNVKMAEVYVMEHVKTLLDHSAAFVPLAMYLIQKEKRVLVRIKFVIGFLIHYS